MIEAVKGVSRPDRLTEAPSVLVVADGWNVRQPGRGGQPTRFMIRGVGDTRRTSACHAY